MAMEATLAHLETRFVGLSTELMTERGWATADEDVGVGSPIMGVFERPVRDGFVCMAVFWLTLEDPGQIKGRQHQPAKFAVEVRVGMKHGPADRLLKHLGAWRGAGIMADGPTLATEAMASVADAERGSRALGELVEEPASRLAREHGTVRAFVRLLRAESSGRDDPDEAFVVPAVLAASGLRDEARRALDEYLAGGGSTAGSPSHREFADRLVAWLEGDGRVPGPDQPTSKVPPLPPRLHPRELEPDEVPTFADRLTQAWRRNQALRAVRGSGSAIDRDQRRALLEQELDRRGLTETPLWIETALDAFDRPSHGGAEPWAPLAKVAGEVLDAIRRGAPTTPTWVLPPPRAFLHEMATPKRRWLAVELDPQARDWLDRVFQALQFTGAGVGSVPVWLQWDPEPRAAYSRLTVNIGKRRVGGVPPEAADSYGPEMDAAANAGCLPRTDGQLARRPHDTFLLQIPMPYPENHDHQTSP